MLPRLLLRDWILQRRQMMVIFAIFIPFELYFAMRASSSRAWAVFSTFYAAFLSMTVFIREDRFRAAAWTCTLPVSRGQIVGARYLEGWLIVAAAVAGATVVAAVTPGSRVVVGEVLDPRTLLILLALATVIFALMMPFTIRFGLLGVMIFLVAAQILGAVMLLIVSMRRGRSTASPSSVRAGLAAIGDGFAALREAIPAPLFFALVVVALAGVNWLAFRLSAHLFRRREL